MKACLLEDFYKKCSLELFASTGEWISCYIQYNCVNIMIHGILFGNKKEKGSLYKQQSGEWKKPDSNAEWLHL